MDHTEALDRASKDYEERVMLLLSKMSNTVGRLLVCTKLKLFIETRQANDYSRSFVKFVQN